MSTNKTLNDIWLPVLSFIQAKLPASIFNAWFKNTEVLEFTEHELKLGAATRFIKAVLEEKYLDLIREAIQEISGWTPTVTIQISPEKFRAMREEQAREGLPRNEIPKADLPPRNPPPSSRQPIPADYDLSTFIPSPCNRLAHAACLRAIEKPGDYNPIFIYGNHGLGKSHLLYGLCSSFSAQHPDKTVVIFSCEMLIREYSQAVVNRRLEAFRNRIRNCHLLAIDDVHLLGQGNRRATQEELLHTFDALLHQGAQLVLTADRSPDRIEGIDERLCGRLSGGLTIRLDPPDRETRRAIALQKAQKRGLSFSDDILDLIADQRVEHVRAIEAMIGRLAAFQTLGGVTLDIRSAAHVLYPERQERPPLELTDIASATAAVFSLSVSDLKGKKRQKNIALARKITIHLARSLTSKSLVEIGEFLGGRSHATIIAALRISPDSLIEPAKLYEKTSQILLRLGRADLDPAELFRHQGELFSPPSSASSPSSFEEGTSAPRTPRAQADSDPSTPNGEQSRSISASSITGIPSDRAFSSLDPGSDPATT